MHIDALCHTTADNMGTLGEAAGMLGINWREIDVANELDRHYNPLGADVLVVLGGSLGAYQIDDFPFIEIELDILRQRLASDRPVLGICLGAQLMATALGSRSYPGACGKERGWHSVALMNGAAQTPLNHFANVPVMHNHGDIFDLPQGCSNLASGPVYTNQAFQYGRNCLALQFHPEVRERELEYWFIGMASDAVAGQLDLQALRRQTQHYHSGLRQATINFFSEWINEVSHA